MLADVKQAKAWHVLVKLNLPSWAFAVDKRTNSPGQTTALEEREAWGTEPERANPWLEADPP